MKKREWKSDRERERKSKCATDRESENNERPVWFMGCLGLSSSCAVFFSELPEHGTAMRHSVRPDKRPRNAGRKNTEEITRLSGSRLRPMSNEPLNISSGC